MIPYQGNLFNFGLLLRIHGSAVYKAVFPSLLSTLIYILLYNLLPGGDDLDLINDRVLSHPYSLAVLLLSETRRKHCSTTYLSMLIIITLANFVVIAEIMQVIPASSVVPYSRVLR